MDKHSSASQKRESGAHMGDALDLVAHQQALMEELYRRGSLLGVMYQGALSVLADGENPDRLTLAAHNLRELMNRIPDYLGVETKDLKVRMGDKVTPLAAAWEQTCNGSSARRGPKEWGGKIDGSLAKFLVDIEEFFEWLLEHRPKRRAVVGKTLRELDDASVPLPEPIQELRITEWQKYYRYFVAVAHHSSAMEDEFGAYLYSLEMYLLHQLRPKTFEDIEEIDVLIREGESHDRS